MYLFIGIFAIIVIKAIIPKTAQSEAQAAAEKEAEIANANKEREDERKTDAYLVSQTFVKRTLKAPSTAKFAKYGYGDDPAKVWRIENGNYQVVIWCDAQNSFGAMLRNKFSLVLKPEGSQWSLVDIKQVN